MHEQAHPTVASIVSLYLSAINWNGLLIILGAIYWCVMIWATIRRDKRESERKDKE